MSGVVVAEGGTTTQNIVLAAAPSFTVSGFVTDEEGYPVAGANVSLADARYEPAVTDSTGFYLVANVPAGIHDVRVEGVPCLDASST